MVLVNTMPLAECPASGMLQLGKGISGIRSKPGIPQRARGHYGGSYLKQGSGLFQTSFLKNI